MGSKKKFYVVWEGRVPGVYDDWEDAREQIENYPGARYKGFGNPAEAAEAFRRMDNGGDAALGAFLLNARTQRKSRHPEVSYRSLPEVEQTAWAVDASCPGNPGPMEYRGVDLASGEEIFRVGPFPDGTNNIGEFLAIVHGMALMEKQGVMHTIYSDSRTAMAWVRNRRVKTLLQPTEKNQKVFELMRRALLWLNTNSFRTKIVKWDTPHWGEIPADFGRK